MFKQNVDFFAVLMIALVMLGFAEVRTWHLSDPLQSIHLENAIDIQRCPISQQVLSNIFENLR
ncbi:MAG TPA: hypothetical protein VFW44_08140 [Bryobacteraceae bacterium]|nr:hypothetical protein [Bryobacteraceae bacterium]